MLVTKPTNVDEYISSFPLEIQVVLSEIRKTIKLTAPQAEEVISYAMPAYKYKGMLVFFAAFKNHVGLYATPSCHIEFKEELSKYKQGKGSVQFPLNQTIPYDLIKKMVAFKVNENEQKIVKTHVK